MAVLIDNLEFLPDAEGRRMRNETRLLLGRHVAAEGVPVVAPTGVSVNVGRKMLVRRISRAARS
jgi:hypothetical protein